MDSEPWDPLGLSRPPQGPSRPEIERLRAAATPPLREALAALAARELNRESYAPGDLFEVATYREGRKSVWREIMRWLDDGND